MTNEVDQYEGWKKLLALAQDATTKDNLRDAIGKAGIEIYETDPLSGFYRARAGAGTPFLPVAIWRDEASAICVTRGGKEVALERVWPYCVWNPVTHEEFVNVSENGAHWSDEDATVAAMVRGEKADNPRAVEGSNSENDTRTPDEIIKDQIAAAKTGAESYTTITSDEQAAQAQSLRSRMLELSGEADKKREAEKAPHWEECKAVDAKWQPLVKAAKGVADTIRSALSAWETKKHRDRLAVEAAETAEKAKRDAVLAAEAEAAKANGQPAPVVEPAEQVAPVEAPKAQNTTIRGGYGRAASSRIVYTAHVVDVMKAAEYFREIPELKTLLTTLAQRAINNGDKEIPGVEIHEEKKVA